MIRTMSFVKKAAAYLTIAIFAVFILLRSSDCVTSAAAGIRMCLEIVIPALFPFIFVSQLSMETGVSDALSIIFGKPLGNLLRLSPRAAQAMILGFLGGYPVGARCAVTLYDERLLSKEETERLLSCCNNCGPSFIFGAVGAGVFGSVAVAAILWGTHVLAAIASGLLLRGKKKAEHAAFRILKNRRAMSFGAAFAKAGVSSFQAIGNICAFVILFSVILQLARWMGLYGLSDNMIYQALVSGFLEMTNGVLTLSRGGGIAAVCCAAFLIGWGGLSVHFQTLSITSGRGLRMRRYFTGKLLQGLISVILVYTLLKALLPRISETIFIITSTGVLQITARFTALFTLPWFALLLLVLLIGESCNRKSK